MPPKSRDALLRENQTVIRQIRQRGADPNKIYSVNFCLVLDNRDAGVAVRQAYREKYDLPGVFIYAQYAKEFQLVLSCDMTLDVEEITLIESRLREVSSDYPDAELFWEFEG